MVSATCSLLLISIFMSMILDNANGYSSSAVVNHPITSIKAVQHENNAVGTARKPTFEKFFKGMQNQRDGKIFVEMLKKVAHSRDMVLTSDEKASLLSEIDFRHNQLNFASLSECLWLIGKMNFKRNDPAVSQLIVDIINSLSVISSRQLNDPNSGINGVSAKAMASLLNGLVHTGERWSDLPSAARELLLSRIALTVFLDSSSYGYLPEVVCSLGKLSAEFRFLDPAFKNAMMDAISAADDNKDCYSIEISKVLYGLAQMRVHWSSDVSESAKVTITNLLSYQCREMREIQIVNSIYSLGKMECRWSSLGGKCQKNLLQDVQRVSNAMAAPAVANTLW
jgi:hypothetical protein